MEELDKEMEKNRECMKENLELSFEIEQLTKIKNYLKDIDDDLNNSNTNLELNRMLEIKNSFEKNTNIYNDSNFFFIIKN